MRPVCVKCGREMQPIQNGVVVYHPYERPSEGPIQETRGGINIIHTDRLISPDHFAGRVDFLAYGDKYRCPFCGIEVVTGFGQQMIDYEVPQETLKKILSKSKNPIEILRR